MKKNDKASKGINGLNFLWFIGLLFVGEKVIEYFKWIIFLIKKWQIPEEPFFSKIDISELGVVLSPTTYLIIGSLYIVFFLFILLGLFYMAKPIELLSKDEVFVKDVSSKFRKAGIAFLIFVIGTFVVDVVFLGIASTSRQVIQLFATDTVLFIIVAYLLFFISDVFLKGIEIQEENALTI